MPGSSELNLDQVRREAKKAGEPENTIFMERTLQKAGLFIQADCSMEEAMIAIYKYIKCVNTVRGNNFFN